MSTPSNIGIINKDKTVTTIYCHWDGYTSHQTPLLLQYYNTEQAVRDLIALGDISMLRKNINPSTTTHSFNQPEPDVVVAYHRDRGDKWTECQPKQYKDIKHLMNNNHNSYIYLFDSNTNVWKYTKNKRFRIFTQPING